MWWEKSVEIITTQFPVAMLFACLAFVAFRSQQRLNAKYVDSLKEQFAEERKRIDAGNAALAAGFQQLIDEGRRERDSLRRERNALKRELGKPAEED